MSSICTPKKLKTTWSVLLKNVGDTGDVKWVWNPIEDEQLLLNLFFSLEGLLEEEDPDYFSHISERSQRAVLRDILGEESDLVDRVIESIRVGKKQVGLYYLCILSLICTGMTIVSLFPLTASNSCGHAEKLHAGTI